VLSSVGRVFLATPFCRVLSLDGAAVSEMATTGLPPVRLAPTNQDNFCEAMTAGRLPTAKNPGQHWI
jgi:hypothetical protein